MSARFDFCGLDFIRLLSKSMKAHVYSLLAIVKFKKEQRRAESGALQDKQIIFGRGVQGDRSGW